jgi:hypothetical protein
MAVSIENRIATLEARLLPVNAEPDVMIIRIVDRSGPTEPGVYDDQHGHVIRRLKGEDSDVFKKRAKTWIRQAHPSADPRAMLVLVGDRRVREGRVTAAYCE